MTRLAPAPSTAARIERRRAVPVDPTALAVEVASAYLEVRAGRRPPEQLDAVLARGARRRLRALVLRQRGREPAACGGASLVRLVTSRPHDDAVEVVAVLRDPRGATAVAVRVDRRAGRWLVTDVGSPEDRQPLVPPGAPQPPPKRRGTS